MAAPDLLPYFTSEEAEQLGLVGYKIDTFSSDYDEFVHEFGTEPRLAPFQAPLLMGPSCNM